MRVFLVALLWLGHAQALFSHERRGRFTIHRRADNDVDDIFPFPANKSSIVDSSSEPGDLPPQDLTVTDSEYTDSGRIPRQFIEKNCDAGKKYKISNAWSEAKQLANAQTSFKIGFNYDVPHTQWLGKDWNSESSWIPWKYNYRKLISDNFRRLAQAFGEHAQSGEYIYWYCYDHARQCTEGVQAYSWDKPGWFWSNHFTVFCDAFYDRQTLNDVMVKHNDNQHEQKVMENFHLNSGHIMLHEVWHYQKFISSPRTEDYAYQAQAVWDLARDHGTSWAYVNADSYALDAVAIYVQQYYKTGMSPVPWRELGKLDVAAAAAVSEPQSDNAVTKTFDDTPPGWDGPLVTNDQPDTSIWTELHLDGSSSADPAPVTDPTPSPGPSPATDDNACHGISGDYWVMSRDVAMDSVMDFCGQSTASKEYNAGSVNNLQLSVRKLDGGNSDPGTAPDCISRFQNAVIDGCDGADPINNPHNYKFGSTLTTADGWEYKLEPLSKQVNEVNCDVSYKFLFDSVEVRGKNFPDATLGVNGEGLENELSGCGALTEWNFERTPDDCCFQWYASAHLPVGTKDCVGRAVVSAGGSSKGNCKREKIRPSIDSWPGYGDDSKHVFSNSIH